MFFNRYCVTFICSFNLSRTLITDSSVCLQIAEMYCLSRENDVPLCIPFLDKIVEMCQQNKKFSPGICLGLYLLFHQCILKLQ